MKAFRMTADQAEMFFSICQEMNWNTEEQRAAVLEAMAQLGQVESVVQTSLTKEAYIKHLADKFGSVVNITSKESI